MTRLIAFCLAFLVAFPAYAADPVDECTSTERGIVCPRDYLVELRDQARAYQILCDKLAGSDVDPLCTDASKTNRVYAKARLTDEARATARKAQRKVNVYRGRLSECAKEKRRLRDQASRAKTFNLVVGAVAVGLGIFAGGEIIGVWDVGF